MDDKELGRGKRERQSFGKDLPSFNGRPEHWLTFISAYRRSTEACSFTKEENLDRLRRSLRGDAFDTIETLHNVPDNVPVILDRLETRFGQKCHIVRSLILKAQETPRVKDNDMHGIISFGQCVLNLVETLKSLKSENQLMNPQLLHDLSEKLPATLRFQ